MFIVNTVNIYEDNATLIQYCQRGQRFIEGYTCDRRATGLANRKGWDRNHPNVQALYRCCLAVTQATGRSGNAQFKRPPPNVNFDKVQIRTYFPESWLFQHDLEDLGYVVRSTQSLLRTILRNTSRTVHCQ